MTKDDFWLLADILTDCVVFDRQHGHRGTWNMDRAAELWGVQNAIRSGDMEKIKLAYEPISRYLEGLGLKLKKD